MAGRGGRVQLPAALQRQPPPPCMHAHLQARAAAAGPHDEGGGRGVVLGWRGRAGGIGCGLDSHAAPDAQHSGLGVDPPARVACVERKARAGGVARQRSAACRAAATSCRAGAARPRRRTPLSQAAERVGQLPAARCVARGLSELIDRQLGGASRSSRSSSCPGWPGTASAAAARQAAGRHWHQALRGRPSSGRCDFSGAQPLAGAADRAGASCWAGCLRGGGSRGLEGRRAGRRVRRQRRRAAGRRRRHRGPGSSPT